MDGLEIIFGEQVEGAEDLVVLKVEGTGSLEVALEGGDVGSFNDELFGCANLAELLLVVRSRDPGRSPRPTAVMIVRVRIHVRRMVLVAVTVELRHGLPIDDDYGGGGC